MNEEKLKAIWNEEKTIPLKNINTELIGQRALESQNKLRKKIKWEIAICILFYILISPGILRYPETLFFLPFVTVIWVWGLYKTLRIYRLETNFRQFNNIKNFLIVKENLLRKEVRQSRCIIYLGSPILWFTFFVVTMSINETKNFWIVVFAFLIFNELISMIFLELYIRKIWKPAIDELTNLLQQLNDQKL